MSCIILDRDGTLIDIVRDEELGVLTTAFHPSQIRILPGVIEGLQLLREHDFTFTIATNQPGPAKGQCSRQAVEHTTAALVKQLAEHQVYISRVETCMHHPEGSVYGDTSLIQNCDCRKPKPGMIHTIVRELKCLPEQTWMIGDSLSDVQSGQAAKIHTALIFAPNRCELCPLRACASSCETRSFQALPEVYAPSFYEVAQLIVAHSKSTL